MAANTIKCPECGEEIELTKALTKDVEKSVLAAEHEKHKAELDRVRKESQTASVKAIEEARTKAETAASTRLGLKLEQALEESEEAKKENKDLRSQLADLLKELRETKKAKENADLEMQKRMATEEGKIRKEAEEKADEKQRLHVAAKDKTITDLKEALQKAQRTASQGSQQLQGEVLELDLEKRLREEFPTDKIEEVKKGQRGADVKQAVVNASGKSCGTILWETKNGKWQPAWIGKFKQDIREAGANIGVLVSQETPDEVGDLSRLEENVWVVKPKLATPLAAALRATILEVDSANTMSAGKDAKMDALYKFLVGPEFKHRVEAIIESYTLLQDEIEKEKRAYVLKWARQEKALRAVIDNTIGMYGDLQGITNRALPAIKTLELDSGEEDQTN